MHLEFRLLSYWQVGSGSGTLGTYDSVAARDRQDLPIIPGKQVKGLCRHAVWQATKIPHLGIPDTMVNTLFGDRTEGGEDEPSPGSLRFTSAKLPRDLRAALAGRKDLIAGLFQSRRSTAMTPDGVAKPHSLRFDEVVVPVTLHAEITGDSKGWEEVLKKALPLIEAVGSGRTRGMGRVIVTEKSK